MKTVSNDFVRRIEDWAKAYPLDVFPEPDMKLVREALEARGITIDCVSASNMRHVITQVSRMLAASSADIPEGCTPTDAKVLRDANHRFIDEVVTLREAATRLLNALDKEATANLSLTVAQANYSDFETERQHSVRAMVEASEATKALKALLETLE